MVIIYLNKLKSSLRDYYLLSLFKIIIILVLSPTITSCVVYPINENIRQIEFFKFINNIFGAKNVHLSYVKNIDEDLLKKAIKEFVGVYDFKYFHKTGSDKENTKREIFDTKFYKYKDIYVFKFCANSYLRSQIRLMVGFLIAINNKKLTIEDLKKQLNCEENIFKTPISPNGLYLSRIFYK